MRTPAGVTPYTRDAIRMDVVPRPCLAQDARIVVVAVRDSETVVRVATEGLTRGFGNHTPNLIPKTAVFKDCRQFPQPRLGTRRA